MQIYNEIVACTLCSTKENFLVRDEHSNIPRGFFTKATSPDDVELVFVAINPGQLIPAERNLYTNQAPVDNVDAHIKFVNTCFHGTNGKPFHRRLLAWATEILGCTELEVFQKSVYTNAVKCATVENRVPNRFVSTTCITKHLLAELDYWRPRAVIALGQKTSQFLTKYGVNHYALPHPSHREHRNYHVSFVENIKLQLNGGKCGE